MGWSNFGFKLFLALLATFMLRAELQRQDATWLRKLTIYCIPGRRLFHFNLSDLSQLVKLELHFNNG